MSLVNLPPEQDIAARAAKIVATDSPLMRAATTAGRQAANRRGVLNSSMGIGAAHAAALGVATPIASQESQQQHATDINRANLSAAQQERIAGAMVQMRGDYNSALAQTLANENIPAAARDAVQRSLRDGYLADAANIAALYGVSLPGWSGGGIGSAYG